MLLSSLWVLVAIGWTSILVFQTTTPMLHNLSPSHPSTFRLPYKQKSFPSQKIGKVEGFSACKVHFLVSCTISFEQITVGNHGIKQLDRFLIEECICFTWKMEFN